MYICTKQTQHMEHKIFKSNKPNVQKFVFEGGDIAVEAVLYKYPTFKERTVICCSTQCGCPVGCHFCGTGKFYVRNLTSLEIVEQVETILSTIDCEPSKIEKLQIMFMSMGEPLLNTHNLIGAIEILNHRYPNASLLISTSAPQTADSKYEDILRIAETIDKVGLQVSVHESTDENRSKLIPTKTKTLKEIGELGEKFALRTGRQPFFNYCVHSGNSSQDDIDRLVSILNPDVWQCTLSVICEKDETMGESLERQLDTINGFRDKMLDAGYGIRVFNPAGQDMGNGCGQLWYFQKWAKDHACVNKQQQK